MTARHVVARRLVIVGRVQGVGYRAWLAGRAAPLGVVGWVRNCPDGTVEALVQGPDDAVAAAIATCRDGPRSAAVTAVVPHDAAVSALDGFRTRPDAPPGTP